MGIPDLAPHFPIYCRHCGYDLRASLEGGRCPECGQPFSPDDPTTFRNRRGVEWRRVLVRYLKIFAITMAVTGLAHVLFFGVCWWAFYDDWKREMDAFSDLEPKVTGRRHPMPLGGAVGEALHHYGLAWVNRVRSLRLRDTATDADLARVKAFHELQWLYLSDTKVTDGGLEHLRGLGKLERIELDRTGITDHGLVPLRDLPALKNLNLRETQVTDAGMVHLESMKTLQTLDLSGTQVTAAGVLRLKATLPACRILGP